MVCQNLICTLFKIDRRAEFGFIRQLMIMKQIVTLVLLGLALVCATPVRHEQVWTAEGGLTNPGDVGQQYLNFSTSTPLPEAQKAFTLGLALQYAFWYDISRDYFDAALALDPNFAMAASMNAMSWIQPLWGYEYPERAVPLLHSIDAMNTVRVTDREWMWINASRALWLSEGPTMYRVGLWRDAMQKVVDAYPEVSSWKTGTVKYGIIIWHVCWSFRMGLE